jgi:hypothetical protein
MKVLFIKEPIDDQNSKENSENLLLVTKTHFISFFKRNLYSSRNRQTGQR